MQKLAEICIRRPVFAAMIILALVVVGAASYFRLGVDRFPSVDLPTVSVRTTLPGASTEEIETEVSQKIEEAVNTVEGIEELRSVSSARQLVRHRHVRPQPRHRAAAQDVRDRVAGGRPQPAATTSSRRSSPSSTTTASPVMSIALSGNRSLRELTELADKVVKVQLERSTGVGEVQIVGGLERAINIWVDRRPAGRLQIPITAVRDAHGAAERRRARRQRHRRRARADAAHHGPLRRTPRSSTTWWSRRVNGAPVRVRDIGCAEDGTKEQRSLARLNGVPTVILEVRRQSGANTVAVIEGVKATLARVAGAAAARREAARSSATSRATSTPRCTRSTCT